MNTLTITVDVTGLTSAQVFALVAEMTAQCEGNDDHPDVVPVVLL